MQQQLSATSWICKQSNINEKSVQACMQLFEEGATIPFIARYRKELTKGLDEVQIEEIHKLAKQFDEVDKRKESILKSIEEQGKLDEKLKQQIMSSYDLTDLEDLYLPYKQRKETKADKARKVGLEPLAKIIMAQDVNHLSDTVKRFINLAVQSEEDALEGARHIISEWMNERKSLRDMLRRNIFHKANFQSKLVKGKEEEGEKYSDYFDWEEPLKRMAAHRFLAMSRGEKEGVLRLKLKVGKEITDQIPSFFIRKENPETEEQIRLAAKDAWKRLLLPSMETEFKTQLKEKADATSIHVFAENLRQLLLEPPLGQKRVLAIDPGFRTGCKVVCLDETGKLLHNETIYPHPPQKEEKQAVKKIQNLVESYKIEAIAIGNGTAGRETDALIKNIPFNHQVYSFVVNESGASVYSASKVAREEFPDYDVTVRGAVSIGRRLMDPLAELVKIDPKSIGVGQYQHDVNQKQLKESLDRVVESCVNLVGVNLNTASKHLLQYISGLGPKLAETIVQFRNENGVFENRESLKKVKGLGDKAFEQSAGFLRIKGGTEALDESGIHPEQYALVKQILKENGIQEAEIKTEREKIEKIDWKKYLSHEVGELTLNDIKAELLKFGEDKRSKRKAFEFDANVKSIEDLKEGMCLPGKVTNITNFGAFVDVGAKQDGLVHISHLANKFVSDPNEVVRLNQEVYVKVMEVDLKRKRIQLSIKEAENG